MNVYTLRPSFLSSRDSLTLVVQGIAALPTTQDLLNNCSRLTPAETHRFHP